MEDIVSYEPFIIDRYEPNSILQDTGYGVVNRVHMVKDREGSYINRYQMQEVLEKLLEGACDPGETDAYNRILRIVKGK